MTAIGPGDWVECVEGDFDPDNGDCVIAGRVYQVAEIRREVPPGCGLHGDSCLEAGIDIVGISDPDWSWCAAQFRPIHPGGALINLLMQPVDPSADPVITPVKEDA